MVHVICITVSNSLGFGKHAPAIDAADMPRILVLQNVSASLGILAAVWSKTSFGITLLRITSGKVKLVVWISIVSMNLLMTVHALMPWIQCYPASKAWYPGKADQCWKPSIGVYYGVAASGIYLRCFGTDRKLTA